MIVEHVIHHLLFNKGSQLSKSKQMYLIVGKVLQPKHIAKLT